MNNSVTSTSCQFSNHRWIIFVEYEFVEACNMSTVEFAVLSRIVSMVQKFHTATDTWDNTGYCSLSIQSIANIWGISRGIVQRSIKVLELAGIVSVQRCYGSTHTITVTPHTEWVVTDFRELREIVKGKQRIPSPSPSPDAHTVTDTLTPSPSPSPDTVTDTVTPSRTPLTVSPIPSPILKPKSDTVTDTGYRHNAYANNIPSSVIGSPCPEDIKAKYCKRAPVTDVDAVTPLTVHVMDTNGNVVDTVALPTNTVTLSSSKGKSKSRKGKSYPPSPNQYADNADDDDALPIFNMKYSEYRASELWHRK